MNIAYFIKNGMYIPFLQIILFNYTQDMLLTFLFGTRLYTINYYYWFGNKVKNLQNNYVLMKQFVRFTDTGHLISLLYYFDNNYYSMAFNIHFIITFGYWIGKFFNISYDEMEKLTDFNETIDILHSTLNHSVHLGILAYRYNYYNNINLFTNRDLCMTYIWLYIWFLFIYIPWRYITGDIVYGFFDNNYPISMKFLYVFIIHSIIYISHNIGKYMLI
jgi:hypothetical protein